MKYYLFVFLAFLSVSFTFSQPNGGFEDWEMEFGNESPVGWQTLNFLCAFPFNPPSATKASGIDKHSGNYALKIKTIHIITNPAPEILYDTIGGAFVGSINLSPLYLKRGYPYTGRPKTLNLWFKYFPVGEDRGSVGAVLTKWNGTKSDTIAISDTSVYYNPIYSLIHLDFTYLSDQFPDTAVVILASSRRSNESRINSTLFVDDVEFSGWVGVNDYDIKNKVTVYPNPAKDELHIKLNSNQKLRINIMDTAGKSVESIALNNNEITVDVKKYPSGIYFYEIIDEKNGVINRAKFTVVE